jgi:hypothetical protein
MLRIALMILLSLVMAVPAMTRDTATDQTGHAAATEAAGRGLESRGTFSSAERNLIRAALLEAERREAAGVPSGLQKKAPRGQSLPPGWQKKMVRGGHLDYDYYNRGEMLPVDLLRRLPPPPPGSEILRIEGKILRVDASSRIILDVFDLGGGY